MTHRRHFGLSFSARRAFGVSAASARISRAIGVPLSRSGRQRKLGRSAGGLGGLLVLAVFILAIAHIL